MSGIDGLGSSLILADFSASLSPSEQSTLASLTTAESDTVSLSDEALAALESADMPSMDDIAQDMTAAQQATVLAADSAGQVLSAMFGDVSMFDGLTAETGDVDYELEALVAML